MPESNRRQWGHAPAPPPNATSEQLETWRQSDTSSPKPIELDENWWKDIENQPPVSVESKPKPTYPEGVANRFYDFAVGAKSRLEGLNLDGTAQIPKAKWQWDYDLEGDTRTKTYAEIADQAHGWKFHLNFDADDSVKVQTVGEFLTALKGEGIVRTFKIGHGGGKAAGAPGKEATVYVGHKDKADRVAPIIEEGLGGLLDLPEGDALHDDIEFTDRVVGRFTAAPDDAEFHQYGAKGHPILNHDVDKMLWGSRDLDAAAKTELKAQMDSRADQILRERYGMFYTGSSQS